MARRVAKTAGHPGALAPGRPPPDAGPAMLIFRFILLVRKSLVWVPNLECLRRVPGSSVSRLSPCHWGCTTRPGVCPAALELEQFQREPRPCGGRNRGLLSGLAPSSAPMEG